ncbi:hypothetical protein FOH10_25095 [Nocardia otitidiscaviarum]|uniref:Uncharacterized protein n=1 Tax=Nocardia otitidiscaviarum TaxID=1823 RepID=A0A516NRJ6_9NOCA|nr:hypothetical protein [Nocardia otitidiscaviarum]MCP9620698.1 hypothetical protein [Nocardia otitidiscaviarum]QDP81511.1 hypothetical protein FOH10_25095 [Nocardia otitidiscaviarum]
MGLVSVPEDANAVTVRVMLSCTNPQWAQSDPHKAMQVHIECEVGVCVTKTVAHQMLREQGKLVPDSGRTR